MEVMVILFVVSLCILWNVRVLATEDDEMLVEAQETLMNSGVGLDLEETHIANMKALQEKLPLAYKKVLESLVAEAETCDKSEPYRRPDGVCNNLENPLYGAVLHYQLRLLPNAYMDGVRIPRMVDSRNNYLPSARTVSVKCFLPNQETDPFLDRRTTQLSMQWGQYIDHDFVFTEVMPGSGCCDDRRHTCVHPDTFTGGPCFPIVIPENDRYFNESCMIFKRSFSVDIEGTHEQVSGVTACVDASTVYGSSQAHQDMLRTHNRGLLKVTDDNMLPTEGHFKCRLNLSPHDHCPKAGDSRVNVFAGLTVMHLLFVREHNRLATKLGELNPHWGDEMLFQETRRIVAALHQKINYEDFLPHVIGEDAMTYFNLKPGNYAYDPNVNPSILNEFGVAAFRYGHSQVNAFVNTGFRKPISETFFQPWEAQRSEGSIKKVLRDQCKRHAQKADSFMTTQLTDKLFLDVDAEGHSTDLAARNVQRGRDHGIQPYTLYLDLALNNFIRRQNISYEYPYKLPDCLGEDVYESLEDVDLFVGGLSENPMKGALVGPTFAYIIAEQFRRLKFGDRFFYESDDSVVGFTPEQLSEVRKLSLAHVICRNSDTKYIQPDVFAATNSQRNNVTSCDNYIDIDLTHWQEANPTNSSTTTTTTN